MPAKRPSFLRLSAIALCLLGGGATLPAGGQKSIFPPSVLQALSKYPKRSIEGAPDVAPALLPSTGSGHTLKAGAEENARLQFLGTYSGPLTLHNFSGGNEESQGNGVLAMELQEGSSHAVLFKITNIKSIAKLTAGASSNMLVPPKMRAGLGRAADGSAPSLAAGLDRLTRVHEDITSFGSSGPGSIYTRPGFGSAGLAGQPFGPGGPAGPGGPGRRRSYGGSYTSRYSETNDLAYSSAASQASAAALLARQAALNGRLLTAPAKRVAADSTTLILIGAGKKLSEDKHKMLESGAIGEETCSAIVDQTGNSAGYQWANIRFTAVGEGIIMVQAAVNNCSLDNKVTRQFTIVGYLKATP